MEPPPEPVSWLELGVLALLLAGSFFFAGTETALASLGEARARALRERLGARGRPLDLWIEHPRRVLAALLLGNNLVNIGATALTTEIALGLFGSAALAIVTGVMTFVVLVFGEITPKTLARESAERWALPCLILLRPFYVVLFPVVFFLERLTRGISQLVQAEGEAPLPVTGEEIDFLIELGSRVGAISGVKRDLLTSVLEFGDLLVREIMVPRIRMVTLDVDASPEEVLALIRESRKSRIPVTQESADNVIGILVAKDLLGVLPNAEGESFDLRGILRPPFFVPEVMKVSRLMKEMQRRHSHLAIVVDEFGGTSGLVTLEDTVEEIVGEIHDETDDEEGAVRRLPNGHLLVEGGLHLRDLEERLGMHFPESDAYESLGGFLTTTAGRIPTIGTLIRFDGHTFVIREADDRRVIRVEVFPQRFEGTTGPHPVLEG